MAPSARFKRLAHVEPQSAPHVAHNDQELLCVQIFSKVSRAQLVWGSLAVIDTTAGVHSPNSALSSTLRLVAKTLSTHLAGPLFQDWPVLGS